MQKTIIKNTFIFFSLTALIIASVFFITQNKKQGIEPAKKAKEKPIFQMDIPKVYTQPLVLSLPSALGAQFSIQPVQAMSVAKIEQGEDKVKYEEAYINTDIIQTLSPNKIKEDISTFLKQVVTEIATAK